jgi:hypothetical protein
LLDTLLIRKDMKDCIRGVVDSLPGDYSAVLVLSEFEGLTNSEIAEVIGISLDTAKIRLHRARTKLRKALEAKCNFYRDERNELSCDRKTTPLKFLKKQMYSFPLPPSIWSKGGGMFVCLLAMDIADIPIIMIAMMVLVSS